MARDQTRGWSRRRFLAGAISTSAVAGVSPGMLAQRGAPSSGSPGHGMPDDARDRLRARLRVMRAALAQEPADLVISGGTLLDTITGELLSGWGVAITGDRIAAIGDVDRYAGATTARVDARRLTLVPGFVDAHYHCE